MTEMQHNPKHVLAAGVLGAAILAIGLAITGALIGGSFAESSADRATRTGSRGITVVGTAERVVTADMAIWPVTVNASGVDLGEAQTQLDREVDSLLVFLVGEGITQTLNTVVTVGVQVNGKLRGTIEVAKGTDKDALIAQAMDLPNVQRILDGKPPRKVIAIPDKIVNVVA